MKQELFNVADEEFMTLLQRTNEGFEQAGIPFMFVGGVANQTHVAKYLCDINQTNLIDLIQSKKIRVQDCLRSTDDVDIVTRLSDDEPNLERKELNARRRIFSILDYIVGDGEHFSPTEDHIVDIKLRRKAHARPVFELGVDGVMYPDKKISFNIYRAPKDLKDGNLKEFEDKFYDTFLDGSVNIALPYSSRGGITLRVKSPEHLLATKIARGRSKDISDALSLVQYSGQSGKPLQYSVVEEILCGEDSRYHVRNEALCQTYSAFMKLVKSLGKQEDH